MTTYDFQKGPHAPFGEGKTPKSAWYMIEPPDRDINNIPTFDGNGDPILDRKGKIVRAEVCELSDAESFELIARSFDLDDWMGKGIPVNKDHLHILKEEETMSYGWIKALHAEKDGLWAYISWNEAGHELVNKDQYAFFSTEYPYEYYEISKETDEESGLPIARPGLLAGLALTNYPANRNQTSMTKSRKPDKEFTRTKSTPISTMINKHPKGGAKKSPQKPAGKPGTRTKSEGTNPTEEEKKLTGNESGEEMQEEIDDLNLNSEEKDPDEIETNSEELVGEEEIPTEEAFFTDLLNALGFDPEDDSVTHADIIARVNDLSAENNDLRDKLKTNRQKLNSAQRLGRFGFRAKRDTKTDDGKAPQGSPALQPGQMDVRTKKMSEFVDAHVKTKRERHEQSGKRWSQNDYSAAVSEAQNKFYRDYPDPSTSTRK